MAKNSGRDADQESFWRRMMGRQASSGRSIRAWCGQQGLKESAFYRWRRKLLRPDGQQQEPWAGRGVKRKRSARRDARNKQSAFVPVRVARDQPASTDPAMALPFAERNGRIEIMLADGRRVRVIGSVDGQMLADVLEVLTSASSIQSEQPGSKMAPLERRAC